MPSQELDLSYNQIEVLDLNYINPALTKLVCTHCSVMKVITKVCPFILLYNNLYNNFTRLLIIIYSNPCFKMYLTLFVESYPMNPFCGCGTRRLLPVA